MKISDVAPTAQHCRRTAGRGEAGAEGASKAAEAGWRDPLIPSSAGLSRAAGTKLAGGVGSRAGRGLTGSGRRLSIAVPRCQLFIPASLPDAVALRQARSGIPEPVLARLEAGGLAVPVKPFEKLPETARNITRLQNSLDAIIACGGDRSISSAAPVVIESGLPLGIISAGTAASVRKWAAC